MILFCTSHKICVCDREYFDMIIFLFKHANVFSLPNSYIYTNESTIIVPFSFGITYTRYSRRHNRIYGFSY